MPEAEILRQHFRDRLLSWVNNFATDTLTVKKTVSIKQLATLTKLVVRSRECLREIKLEQPILLVVLAGGVAESKYDSKNFLQKQID